MATQVLMPALSPTMTEGKLARWMKAEGDAVASGDILAEIETDKATMEIEAVDEGILGKILVAEGTEGVPVNQLIGLILEDGEDASALEGAAEQAPAPAVQQAPAPSPVPAPTTSAPAAAPTPAPTTPPTPASVPTSAPIPAPASMKAGRVIASPLARRLAAEKDWTSPPSPAPVPRAASSSATSKLPFRALRARLHSRPLRLHRLLRPLQLRRPRLHLFRRSTATIRCSAPCPISRRYPIRPFAKSLPSG